MKQQEPIKVVLKECLRNVARVGEQNDFTISSHKGNVVVLPEQLRGEECP